MSAAMDLLGGVVLAAAIVWAWRMRRGGALYWLAGFTALGAMADFAGYGIKSQTPYDLGLTVLLALSGFFTCRLRRPAQLR